MAGSLKRQKKAVKSKVTRIEILAKKLEDQCVEGCLGQWLIIAIDILNRNGLDVTVFVNLVHILLEKGSEGSGKLQKDILAKHNIQNLQHVQQSCYRHFCLGGSQECRCDFPE